VPAGPLPPAAVVVSHTVQDFDAWLAAFVAGEPDRRDAGILGHHVNRAEHDPGQVSIYLAVSNVDRAKAFASSSKLQEDMKEAGVTSPPQVAWMTPVREDIVWGGEHPAMIVQHRVADFDHWLEVYDGARDMQRAAGVTGHAANRSLDDPSLVVVYHQADSFDTLRSMVASPDIRAAMEAAGVISEPEASFHMGGWAKRYV